MVEVSSGVGRCRVRLSFCIRFVVLAVVWRGMVFYSDKRDFFFFLIVGEYSVREFISFFGGSGF